MKQIIRLIVASAACINALFNPQEHHDQIRALQMAIYGPGRHYIEDCVGQDAIKRVRDYFGESGETLFKYSLEELMEFIGKCIYIFTNDNQGNPEEVGSLLEIAKTEVSKPKYRHSIEIKKYIDFIDELWRLTMEFSPKIKDTLKKANDGSNYVEVVSDLSKLGSKIATDSLMRCVPLAPNKPRYHWGCWNIFFDAISGLANLPNIIGHCSSRQDIWIWLGDSAFYFSPYSIISKELSLLLHERDEIVGPYTELRENMLYLRTYKEARQVLEFLVERNYCFDTLRELWGFIQKLKSQLQINLECSLFQGSPRHELYLKTIQNLEFQWEKWNRKLSREASLCSFLSGRG